MGVARAEALALVQRAAEGSPLTLVGIGGHGGAGKSALAAAIPGAHVVATDVFWDGERFDLERLRREVVDPLTRGKPARYGLYDRKRGRIGEERVVAAQGIVVVEGVCALHRLLRDAYAVRILVEAPYGVRLTRGVARDGESARSLWVDVWMPAEERYLAADNPAACAHLIVDGTL